ncbi:MAG TPA: hypothetical protein VJM12_02945 [Pyrinomonadaceae bacterium]|nr:hypothetical protein [Pyrinomonadaceae bacterium]
MNTTDEAAYRISQQNEHYTYNGKLWRFISWLVDQHQREAWFFDQSVLPAEIYAYVPHIKIKSVGDDSVYISPHPNLL